jgi:hypothetical protein
MLWAGWCVLNRDAGTVPSVLSLKKAYRRSVCGTAILAVFGHGRDARATSWHGQEALARITSKDMQSVSVQSLSRR